MSELNSTCLVCAGDFQKKLEVIDHFLTQEAFEIQRCDTCGLRRTSPIPPPDDITRYYETEDYLSHGADQKGMFAWLYRVAKNINLNKKARLINQLIPNSELLDYGCGTGDFIGYCQELGFKVRGAEPSAQALLQASPLVIDKILSPEDELASESKYDIITMWHVLEHIHEPLVVLGRLKQKLKTNGYIIIAVPNPDSYDARHYGQQWAGWDVPRHLWHFEPKAIIHMMNKLGFEEKSSLPMWFDAIYVSILSERYKRGFAPMALLWAGLSNFKALFDKKRKCSSQIYVFKVI